MSIDSRFSQRLNIGLIQVAAVLCVGAALWFLSLFAPLVPTPKAVVQAALELVLSPTFYRHLWITVHEALVGLAIAAVLGIIIGVGIGLSKGLIAFFNPIILALYAVPKIVFLPILLILFGVGIGPKIANAALHAVFPILLNALMATAEINQLWLKAARSMRATRGQLFHYVLLPSMVLPVFTGMKLGIGLSLLGALLAELFESTAGIAFLITRFYSEGRIDEMLAVICILIICIVIVNAVAKAIEGGLSRWRHA